MPGQRFDSRGSVEPISKTGLTKGYLNIGLALSAHMADEEPNYLSVVRAICVFAFCGN